jgi:hypothetical protein
MGKTIQVRPCQSSKDCCDRTGWLLSMQWLYLLLCMQAISLVVTHRTDDFQTVYDPAKAVASALQPGTPDQVAPRPVIALRSALGGPTTQQQDQCVVATHTAVNGTKESGYHLGAGKSSVEPVCNNHVHHSKEGARHHHHTHDTHGRGCNGQCSSKLGNAGYESASGPATPSPSNGNNSGGSGGVAFSAPRAAGSAEGIAERAAAASKLKCPHKRLKGSTGPCPECEREMAPVAAEEVRQEGRAAQQGQAQLCVARDPAAPAVLATSPVCLCLSCRSCLVTVVPPWWCAPWWRSSNGARSVNKGGGGGRAGAPSQ